MISLDWWQVFVVVCALVLCGWLIGFAFGMDVNRRRPW